MRQSLTAVVLLSTSLLAQQKFTPLNVKTGLWEATNTVTTKGEMPIPPEMLARLTPEQRARMEQRMKANSASQTHSTTDRSCVTKDKLEDGKIFDNKECTETLISSTGSKLQLHVTCEMSSMKGSGDLLIEAPNSETTKGSGHMTMTGGGHTMDVTSTLSGKWISSSCGDVK